MKANKTILVVDDSRTSRKFVMQSLEKSGFSLLEAGNGIEAMKIVETASPDALILDLLMPEMDGFQVLENLRAKSISLPVIVLTADIQEEVKEEVLELGAVAVLNKPYEEERLLKILMEIF